MTRTISLITDYGQRDGYVGALKGVLRAAAPNAVVVDITHQIPPQDVLAGAVAVLTACRDFPADSIHVVVVDPEVGSDRPGLLLRAWGQWFVAPDSGVLHFALAAADAEVRRLNPNLRQPRSAGTTFDGRDWFAPAAAALANGASIDDLGTPTDDWLELDLPQPTFEPYRWVGHVLHIDHFGNCISDLPAPATNIRGTTRSFLGADPIGPIRTAFSAVAEGGAVATIGALGTVEIAVNGGSAAARFGARRGDRVELLFPSPQPTPALPW